ncbi:MAG: SLOG family protein [Eubacteriales bacterium]|nr:SLOG family protein [Eubacteriales bacterium]
MEKPEARSGICCFTGHRPEKLKREESEILRLLEAEIKRALSDGFTTFITGMAQGVDIWAGEIVLKLKERHPGLKLIAALPYPGCERRWRAAWKKRFANVAEKANQVISVSPAYSPGVYQKRDQWMVDHAQLVIAVYDGAPGGTEDTIAHAKERGVEVRLL